MTGPLLSQRPPIVGAISEGRQLLGNLKSSFTFLRMVHIPLVTSAALVPLLGYPLLYLPVHIVWLELIVHPAALLAFQQPATAELPKRPRATRFFDRREWLVIAGIGIATATALFLLFVQAIEAGQGAGHARTLALVALLVTQARLGRAFDERARARGLGDCYSEGSKRFPVPADPGNSRHLNLHPLTTIEWIRAATIGLVVPVGTTLAFRWVSRVWRFDGADLPQAAT